MCVPAVVREEAVNRVRKRVMEANPKIDAVRRLTGDESTPSKVHVDLAVRSYEESTTVLLKSLNARFLAVRHEQLVKRSLSG